MLPDEPLAWTESNPAAGVAPFEAFETARFAMGDRRRLAELVKGRYDVEWFNVSTRKAVTADPIDVPAGGRRRSRHRSDGLAVLYVRRPDR